MDNDQAVEILSKTAKVIEQLDMCERLIELANQLRETSDEIKNGTPFVTSHEPRFLADAFISFIEQLITHHRHEVKAYFNKVREELPVPSTEYGYNVEVLRFGKYILRTNHSETVTFLDVSKPNHVTYKVVREPKDEKFSVSILIY